MTLYKPFGNMPHPYDGCGCSCHRIPGTKHVMPCCGPGSIGYPNGEPHFEDVDPPLDLPIEEAPKE